MDKSDKELLKNLKDEQQTVISDIKIIKMAICGSDELGVEGMAKKVNRHDECLKDSSNIIDKVNKHDKYIEADKKQKWMFAGIITAIFI